MVEVRRCGSLESRVASCRIQHRACHALQKGVCVRQTDASHAPGLVARERELADMSGRHVLLEIDSLGSSARVFSDNYRELRGYVARSQADPRNSLIWDMARRRERDIIWAETGRLVHNFLASAFSLVDHTRVANRRVVPGGLPNYSAEVERRFASEGLVQFVQGLRNYSAHWRPLPLRMTSRLIPATELVVGLNKGELLSWEGWNTRAKHWLQTAADNISILQVSGEYFGKVREFHAWFENAVRHVRHGDISRFRDKEMAYFLFKIESSLDGWLVSPANVRPLGDRGLFLGLFDLEDFEILEAMPAGSPSRGDAALSMLGRHFVVPAHVASKLRRAYADPRFFPS